VVTADGRLHGWVGGSCSEPLVRREALLALERGEPILIHIVGGAEEVRQSRGRGELTMATTCPSGGSLDVFLEPQVPKPLLMVFGATPAARALLGMGALSGFRTCAVHPGARAEEFPGADLVLPDLDLGRAAPGGDSWAVVATMGHYDEDALEAALAYPQLDVALIASTVEHCHAAGVFTTNQVIAAPCVVTKKHAARGHLRGIVVNSGNANACTGPQGERDAVAYERDLAGGCAHVDRAGDVGRRQIGADCAAIEAEQRLVRQNKRDRVVVRRAATRRAGFLAKARHHQIGADRYA